MTKASDYTPELHQKDHGDTDAAMRVTAIKAGDKIIVSDAWLKTCGMSVFSGDTWTVKRVQPMVGDEVMYHVEHDTIGKVWSVWSIRGVTKA